MGGLSSPGVSAQGCGWNDVKVARTGVKVATNVGGEGKWEWGGSRTVFQIMNLSPK